MKNANAKGLAWTLICIGQVLADRRDIFLEEKEDTLSRIRKYRKVSVVQHLNTDCREGPVGDATNDASECFSIFFESTEFFFRQKSQGCGIEKLK